MNSQLPDGGTDGSGLTHGTEYYVAVVNTHRVKLLSTAPSVVNLAAAKPWGASPAYLLQDDNPIEDENDDRDDDEKSETVLKVDIVTDADGEPSVMINQRGEGYEAGDIVAVNLKTMTEDDTTIANILQKLDEKFDISLGVDAHGLVVNGENALVALFDVADLLTTGGDLDVTATDTRYSFTRGTGFFANQAELEIGDSVTLKGRNVNLSATADNTDPTEDGVVDTARVNEVIHDKKENKELIEGVTVDTGATIFDTVARYAGQYVPFSGIGVLDVDATVSVGSGTEITAVHDVDVRTNATSAVEKYTAFFAFMVGVQSTDVTSIIGLGEAGANQKPLSITSGGDIRVLSVADNDTALELTVSGAPGKLWRNCPRSALE